MKIITSIILITLSLELELKLNNQEIQKNFKKFANFQLLLKTLQSTNKNFASMTKDLNLKIQTVKGHFKPENKKGNENKNYFTFSYGIKKQDLKNVFLKLRRQMQIPDNKSGLFNNALRDILNMDSNVWSLINIIFCFNGNLVKSYMFLINNRGDRIDICLYEMLTLKMQVPSQMFISSTSISKNGGEFKKHSQNLFIKPKNIPDLVLTNMLDIYEIFGIASLNYINGIKQ